MPVEVWSPFSFSSAKVAADTRWNLGTTTEFMKFLMGFANTYTGVVDFMNENAFGDGFNNTVGISAGDSTNTNTSETGVVKPTVNTPAWISGGTPSAGVGSGGSGTAANFNDNSAGTTYTRALGSLAGVPAVASRIFAKVDLGSSQTISKIVLSQVRLSAGSSSADGLYYSTDNTNWTQLGSNFGTNSTPADITQTGVVTARYVAHVLSQINYSVNVTIADLLAYDNASGPNSIDVRSVNKVINDIPALVDVFMMVEETDALTLSGGSPDFVIYGSRDGNNSYVSGTTERLAVLPNGYSIICARALNVSGQGSAKNLRWRATSANSKNFKIHAVAVMGRA